MALGGVGTSSTGMPQPAPMDQIKSEKRLRLMTGGSTSLGGVKTDPRPRRGLRAGPLRAGQRNGDSSFFRTLPRWTRKTSIFCPPPRTGFPPRASCRNPPHAEKVNPEASRFCCLGNLFGLGSFSDLGRAGGSRRPKWPEGRDHKKGIPKGCLRCDSLLPPPQSAPTGGWTSFPRQGLHLYRSLPRQALLCADVLRVKTPAESQPNSNSAEEQMLLQQRC